MFIWPPTHTYFLAQYFLTKNKRYGWVVYLFHILYSKEKYMQLITMLRKENHSHGKWNLKKQCACISGLIVQERTNIIFLKVWTTGSWEFIFSINYVRFVCAIFKCFKNAIFCFACLNYSTNLLHLYFIYICLYIVIFK